MQQRHWISRKGTSNGAFKLKTSTVISNGSEGHRWNFCVVSSIWTQIILKRGIWGLTHFSYIFYVNTKVRFADMGTFFEPMVLKLWTGYLVHIMKYVWKCFAIAPIQNEIGKRVLFQSRTEHKCRVWKKILT